MRSSSPTDQWIQMVGSSKVYDPGCHCAFTDITHWRGRIWLTCREALNHSIHPSSQIVVLASASISMARSRSA